MLIGITMGDASGVGPELALRAYKNKEINDKFVIIGDYDILQYCNELLKLDLKLLKINDVKEAVSGSINIIDLGILKREDLKIGQISEKSGFAAMKYVEHATCLALNKEIDAIVTLPMNKEATRLSDKNFTGHTEFIAGMCGQNNYTMMLASDQLVVTHVNTHVSMLDAIKNVKMDKVYSVILLTWDALSRYIESPRIAVAGLNAHAGENGSFGSEDMDEIQPAVEKAKTAGMNVEGPLPPDTVFLKAYKKQYDAVVCMYHDQGHIPMKLLDFEGGVNVTLGLKVIRTSVDHGTAFDIAYKGIASTKSLVEAFKYAVNLVGKD